LEKNSKKTRDEKGNPENVVHSCSPSSYYMILCVVNNTIVMMIQTTSWKLKT
jgi:hypothetical protein